MEERFSQQLKKGVLEMLVLQMICEKPAYGYELLTKLEARSGGLLKLKEGTLYPILYRLEDDGMIEADWSQGEGRVTPKKIYAATDRGREAHLRQRQVWRQFTETVDRFLAGGNEG